MRARLVRIGNSRGTRLPKPLIEEAGLGEDVEFLIREGPIGITSIQRPRMGWDAAAARLRRLDEDRLLDPPTRTRFDADEWQW